MFLIVCTHSSEYCSFCCSFMHALVFYAQSRRLLFVRISEPELYSKINSTQTQVCVLFMVGVKRLELPTSSALPPLAVPKICFPLGARANFDRCAIKHFAFSSTGCARVLCPKQAPAFCQDIGTRALFKNK